MYLVKDAFSRSAFILAHVSLEILFYFKIKTWVEWTLCSSLLNLFSLCSFWIIQLYNKQSSSFWLFYYKQPGSSMRNTHVKWRMVFYIATKISTNIWCGFWTLNTDSCYLHYIHKSEEFGDCIFQLTNKSSSKTNHVHETESHFPKTSQFKMAQHSPSAAVRFISHLPFILSCNHAAMSRTWRTFMLPNSQLYSSLSRTIIRISSDYFRSSCAPLTATSLCQSLSRSLLWVLWMQTAETCSRNDGGKLWSMMIVTNSGIMNTECNIVALRFWFRLLLSHFMLWRTWSGWVGARIILLRGTSVLFELKQWLLWFEHFFFVSIFSMRLVVEIGPFWESFL